LATERHGIRPEPLGLKVPCRFLKGFARYSGHQALGGLDPARRLIEDALPRIFFDHQESAVVFDDSGNRNARFQLMSLSMAHFCKPRYGSKKDHA
jgi:hypothetical protein